MEPNRNRRIKNPDDFREWFPVISTGLAVLDLRPVKYFVALIFVAFIAWSASVLTIGVMRQSRDFYLSLGVTVLPLAALCLELGLYYVWNANWTATKKCFANLNWDFSCLSDDERLTISRFIRHCERMFVVLCLVLGVLAVVVYLQAYQQLSNNPQAMPYVSSFILHPYGRVIVKWVLLVMSAFGGLLVPWILHYPIYCGLLIRIQLILLSAKVRRFAKHMPKTLKLIPLYVDNYLRDIIVEHHRLVRVGLTLKTKMFATGLLMMITSLIYTLFLAAVLFSRFYTSNATIVAYLAMFIVAYYFPHQRQIIEDQMDVFQFLLYDLNWHEWTVAQQRTLYMFLMTASVDEQSNIDFVRLNHKVLTNVVRTAYVIINACRTILDK